MRAANAETAGGNFDHDTELMAILADHLKCNAEDIGDLDLCLFDAEPSRLIGAHEDFVYSSRIDNLVSVWAQFQGLIDFSSEGSNVADFEDIAMCCAFGHDLVKHSVCFLDPFASNWAVLLQ